MRFSILAKIGLLFAAVLVAAMASVLWNTNRVFYQDKEAFVVEINSKLSQSVSQVMSEKVNGLISKLAIFASNYESLSANQKKQAELNSVLFAQYENFYHISSIKISDKSVLWQVSNDLSSANTWPIGYAGTLIPNLALNKSSQDGLYFQRLSAPDGKPVFAMIIQAQLQKSGSSTGEVEKIALVGIVKPSIFEDVVTNYKAALNTAFLVDESGFVYAHPEDSLLGQSLIKNSLVNEIRSKAKPAGAGDSFKDSKGIEIAGGYEKVGSTNLYAVITTPRKEAFRAANELFKTLIVIGAGVLIVGMVLSFMFAQLITSPLKKLKNVAAEIGSGNFDVPVEVVSKDEVGDLASSISQMAVSLVERDEALESSKMALLQSEKMSAFGQLSAGIAHEVKNPLAGILGHAQLAKSKIKSDDILKHIEVIESETRRTKEIIEGLMKFARAEKLELQPFNMWDVVQGAVDLVEHQLSLQGVKIYRNIQHVPCVLANGTQIQQVMLNLMMNAGHAMEECDSKELHIYLDVDEEKDVARIRIQDTGTGMPEEVANKIFEPFFTTKPAGKGTGLGLSVSVGIVKDHNADIYVESEMGVGTTFFIDFPICHDQANPESEYSPKFGADSAEGGHAPSKKDEAAPVVTAEVVSESGDEQVEAQTSEDDIVIFDDETSISESIPSAPSSESEEEEFKLDIPSAPVMASDDDEDEEEFSFQEQSLSKTADDLDKEEFSAVDALAGFSLDSDDDDDAIELEEKTIVGEVPDMPASDAKNEDEKTEIIDNAETEEVAKDFSVKIRKPKIKR